ncbi:pilus assembly protein TadG-related protein [Pseudomonas putida]|uniref:pilus assembly protein TadG-related protein n=1 Tax=Pseudomonas putida TaxID=303 RepID=UPI002364331C|nr:pilus assembly protein TadG-related protein [Pseudomonas putida]MDD2053173.1 pilus assembly protein TadG-related protein [Pseudomonas putida]
MSPPLHSRLPSRQPNLPSRQRGAIGLIAAVTLGFSLLFLLLVVDSGRLYMEKRKLQRIADTAALEAVSRKGTCVAPALTATAYATQSATRNGFTVTSNSPLTVACGSLVTGSDNLRTLAVDPSKSSAVRVIVSRPVVTSVAAGVAALFAGGTPSLNTRLTATAVAAAPAPLLAQLSIRSTVADVSLLNPLFTAFLGSSVNLSVANWNSLLATNVSLLNFLDQLAIKLQVQAGNYTQLLTTNATIGDLITTVATVAQANGPSVDLTNALTGLKLAAINPAALNLGDILKLQTGTQSAGLDTQVNLFQLIEGFVQLSNNKSSVAASLPITVPIAGLTLTTQVKVTEPPQLSMIGNPLLAQQAPQGPNQIYVRTAQVRTLISLNLGIVGTLLTSLNTLLSPIIGLLNTALSLDVGCVLGGQCVKTDLLLFPNGTNLDISLEAGRGSSYVTGYTCVSDTNKSLSISATTSVANLMIGRVTSANWLSSTSPLTVAPLPLIDIGSRVCNGLFGSCGARTSYTGGGTDLMINSSVLATTATNTFINPPNIGQQYTPAYPPFVLTASGALASMKGTVSGISLIQHAPTLNPGILGVLLNTLTGLLSQAVTLLSSTLSGILSPLLDTLIDNLLVALGIEVGKIQVDANLSCGQPGLAYLVI